MMQLTEFFSARELGVEGAGPRLIENAQFLCDLVLDEVREHFRRPVVVHDGYRAPERNLAVGGVGDSFHLFDGQKAAADFHVEGVGLTEVFDWLRLESKIAFDKVILEHSKDGTPRCIHVQVDRAATPRRQAFTGRTNGASAAYERVEVG